jgi:RNA polymerase sigma-70 factor (ECF subfamily)
MRQAQADERMDRFRALALPLLGKFHRLAIGLTGNQQRAEDLVQDTMLRAWRYFDTYQGDDFRAWMAVIMRNLYRSKAAPAALSTDSEWLSEVADLSPNPEQEVLARDRAQRLRHLIDTLPEALRETLVMREFGGLSYTQIALAQSVPVGTVMSRLSRARNDLRAAWLAAHDGDVS